MGTGVGTGFDFSGLNKACKEIDKRIGDIIRKGNTMEQSLTKNFQNIAKNGIEPFINKLQQINTSLGGTSKVVDMINRIVMAFGKLKGDTKVGVSTKDGDAAIKKLQKEIAQLQKQQEKTAQQVDKWKNKYDKLSQSVKRGGDNAKNFQETQSKMLDTAGQLKRALAAVFSVSAIKGYVNKLMQIRGEFELQQRSLQVLLQNKDEANALWDKTVALAVKSPYTTKQLVTATKQLAAYRIESEKLYETNKMLADVSIGLGVDMNRLILAFGQVKAANFLRGTELRQFSEAGVNMLDELAKRFTALEGRAVSVGEVFERVSKRMVSFADVEAVFKTITSEGGVFYQMQEKQSETLKGMMLNLKDSYELMLNDIGKSNEGMLKGFVSMMKTLVDNWRDLAPFINTAGVALITYFGTGVLKGIAKYSAMILNIWKAHPFIMVASVAATVVTLIYNIVNATNELSDAMLEVEKNVGESLEESIGLYRKLTDTINDSTASLDERNEAYENLKTKFKDILPDQLTELKYIESLAFNYKAAEDAMFSYYNAKAIEQKKDKIEGIYEGDFDRDTKDIIRQIKENIDDIDRLNEEQKTRMKAGVSSAVYKAIEELREGNISDKTLTSSGLSAVANNLVREIEKNLKTFSGDYVTLLDSNVFKNAKELAETAKEYRDAMSDVSGLAYQTFDQKQAHEAQEAFKEEMDTATKYFKDLVLLRQKIADNKIDLTTPDTELNEEQLSKREWYLNSIQNIYNALVKDVPQYANKIKELDNTLLDSANKGAYEYKLALGGIENALLNAFTENAKSLSSADDGAQAMLDNFAENIKATADSKLATPLQQAIISAFDLAIKERDIDQKGKDLLAKLLPDSKQTTEDVRKSVEALLKQYQDEVKKWENATAAGATKLPFVEYLNQFGNTEFKSAISQYLGSTEEFKNLEQKMIPVLEHIYKLLGGDPDKKGGSRDLVDERLRVIKEIYKAYKELNKTFDETTSKTGAMEKFGDAFYSAFGQNPEEMGYNLFTAEGVVDAYNKFISTLSKADDITKGNLAKGEFVMELQVEMQQKKDKDFQDEIEQMFSGYELSLELEKLNIPRELAESLFDVDTFDLSDIRTKLEQELYRLQTAGGGKDQIKQIQEFLKKVSQMEQKEQKEQMKEFVNFVKNAYDEIFLIQNKGALQIALADKYLKEGVITIEQYGQAISRISKTVNNDVGKIKIEQFKESPEYIAAMGNMAAYSESQLETMIETLEKLIATSAKAMSVEELTKYREAISKMREELKSRETPWDKTIFAELKEELKLQKQLATAQEERNRLLQEQSSLQEEIKRLQTQNPIDDPNAAKDLLVQKIAKLQGVNTELADTELKIQGIGDALGGALGGAAGAISIIDKIIKAVYQGIEAHIKMYNDLKDLVESYGVDTENKEWSEASKSFEIIGNFNNEVMQGWENFKSGNLLGAIANTVGSITKLIQGINEAADIENIKRIEAEIKTVEKLEKSYEDLKETLDGVYEMQELQNTYKLASDNIEARINATERMIAAEEAKKNTDEEAIEGYKDEIDELKDKYKELEETRLQALGAFATDENKKSGAEAFLDAWIEAYKQTGDGLTGLNEQFDEFFDDMIKKQLLQRGAQKYLSQFYNEFDNAIADWGAGNIEGDDAINLIEQAKNRYMPELNDVLKRIAEAFGIAGDLAGSTAELSGLQAGIQGLTESQGDVLASYWNSVRGYTADTNAKVTELAAKLFSDDTTANPMLAQLLTIAEQTHAIRDLFDSVVGRGNGGTHSGAYLKVAVG